MKKGKSRNKRKKTRSRLLWIAIAVIGIAAVISAVCVAGMLATKENAWKTPEELLVEYMDHIPKQEYEEMYAMLHIEASGNVSQEDFVTRNSAIYEGIEVQNIAVQIIAYDEEQMTVTYQTSFDTVAGTISFENKALFLKDEEGYQLVWDDSLIFPNLASTDKVRVSTTQAERGEILDRNGRVLAGKGTASSVGIVPGKLENREEAIAQIAELVEITPEAIEKKLSANDSNGTGYAAHRDDILLAGKTGTAEIKASKDDTSGTELGWFAIFTAEDTVERPILIISMVEDVKGRGGSGYVVKKDNLVLEEWFGSN